MCGGRTALHHQQPDDAYDPASAGKTSITVTASGGDASNPDAGSAHGGSPIDSGLSGGASGAAGEPNDVVGDQAVSDPISFPVWPTSPVTSLASHFYSPSLALACSDANCLVFWAKKKGAHFARVTFDGVWLDPNPGTYVGRVWDYSWQQTYPPIAVVSDGARYLLLWQQYNGAELRWVVRRLEARAGGWVDPEPIPISGFVSALPTPGGGTILRPSLPAALAWDGQHFLAVIPHQEQLHAVLLEQDRAALKVSSDLPLGSDADLSRVSVTSAMPGSFVVFWNNGSAAEPHARALLLRPYRACSMHPHPGRFRKLHITRTQPSPAKRDSIC